MDEDFILQYAGEVHCNGCARRLAELMHEQKVDTITSELIETENVILVNGTAHHEGKPSYTVTAFIAFKSTDKVKVYTVSNAIIGLVKMAEIEMAQAEARAMNKAGDLINKIKQQAH